MEKCLITGGCGYVGRALVARAARSFDVHVLDNCSYGTKRLRSMDLAAFTLHLGDVRDGAGVHALLERVRPDVVVHLAAIHFIPACERDPHLAVATNVDGTAALLAALPTSARFVYASSAAVYAPSGSPHAETDEVCATDVYGLTKLHGEDWCRRLRSGAGSTWLVRLFNVIGPGETNPHLLPTIFAQLKRGDYVLRLGNMATKRDYIHVDDAAEGFLRLANTESHGPEAVNLGTGTSLAGQELLSQLREVTGQPIDVRTDPARVRAVDRPDLRADLVKLRRVLGWTPRPRVRATLEEMWKGSEDFQEVAG